MPVRTIVIKAIAAIVLFIIIAIILLLSRLSRLTLDQMPSQLQSGGHACHHLSRAGPDSRGPATAQVSGPPAGYGIHGLGDLERVAAAEVQQDGPRLLGHQVHDPFFRRVCVVMPHGMARPSTDGSAAYTRRAQRRSRSLRFAPPSLARPRHHAH